MTNDAKLGLVVGVGLVIAVAVIFFRKDSAPTPPPNQDGSAPAIPTPGSHDTARPPKARPTVLSTGGERRHTVAPGETLAVLAEQYYGDRDKAAELYRANRERLTTAETLNPGTELIIPEMEPTEDAPDDANAGS